MMVSGILFFSPVFDMGGFGNVSRNYLRAFERANIPVKIIPTGESSQQIGPDLISWIEGLSTDDIGDNLAVVVHADPFAIGNIKNQIGVNKNFVSKFIAITIFETDRIPDGASHGCNQFDEVWVPSEFNVETFVNSGVERSKLKVVPYNIDETIYYPSRKFTPITHITDKNFKMIHVSGFDYRKGYNLLIRAYSEEFKASDNISLILKIYQPGWSSHINIESYFNSMIDDIVDKPEINIITERVDRDVLIDLYQTSDVYVSTERASGWGMPEMEMMALGKPAITIDWGGSTQFMNSGNSFPIKVEDELEPVSMNLSQARPTYRGHKWAKVTVDSVRKTLREAYDNKEKRDSISRQAIHDIHTYFSTDAIAKIIKETLGA